MMMWCDAAVPVQSTGSSLPSRFLHPLWQNSIALIGPHRSHSKNYFFNENPCFHLFLARRCFVCGLAFQRRLRTYVTLHCECFNRGLPIVHVNYSTVECTESTTIFSHSSVLHLYFRTPAPRYSPISSSIRILTFVCLPRSDSGGHAELEFLWERFEPDGRRQRDPDCGCSAAPAPVLMIARQLATESSFSTVGHDLKRVSHHLYAYRRSEHDLRSTKL